MPRYLYHLVCNACKLPLESDDLRCSGAVVEDALIRKGKGKGTLIPNPWCSCAPDPRYVDRLASLQPRYVDRHGDTLGYVSPELRDQDGVTVECPVCGDHLFGTDLISTDHGYVCETCADGQPPHEQIGLDGSECYSGYGDCGCPYCDALLSHMKRDHIDTCPYNPNNG